jgi:hypothetical protein
MHLPAATIRTQVMRPLRFADGFGTTARVYTFDGLADGREHLAPRPTSTVQSALARESNQAAAERRRRWPHSTGLR